MTNQPRTTSDVFVDAVRDYLNGTPNASHPVQFESTGSSRFVVCTLCGAAVPAKDKWQDMHRKNHDDHNKAHGGIEEQARRYVMPPRYG